MLQNDDVLSSSVCTGMLLPGDSFLHNILLPKAAIGVCFLRAPVDSYPVPELCCIMSNGVELSITLCVV